jgi:hypothetical protein
MGDAPFDAKKGDKRRMERERKLSRQQVLCRCSSDLEGGLEEGSEDENWVRSPKILLCELKRR